MNAHVSFEEHVIALRNAGLSREKVAAAIGCSIYRVRKFIDPDHKSRLRERRAVPPVSRDWLRVASCVPNLLVDDVKRAACEHFEVSSVVLCAKRRDETSIYRRHLAIYVACEDTGKSLPQIGARFGALDHTTVLHARRRIARLISAGDKLVIADVEAIRARVSERKGVVG